MEQNSYRKFGTGNDCAGHKSVMLCFRRISIIRLLSPDVNFGATLPTGSKHNGILFKKIKVIHYMGPECWIRASILEISNILFT